MKMSDIFTLPFVLTKKEDIVNGIPVTKFILTEDGGKKSYNTAILGYEKTSAQWIVDALNAHDTHLSDIQLLLDRLEQIHKKAKLPIETSCWWALTDIATIAHEAVTELRELYPKGEK